VLSTDDASFASAGTGPRVLVVGPDPLARAGLAALLADDAGCTVIGQVAAGTGLAGSLDGPAPDVVVWDLGGDPARELEHMADLTGAGPPIVALVEDETAALDALAAGARGLLPRHGAASTLAAAVRAAARGLVVLDPDLAPGAWRERDAQAPAPGPGPAAPVEELTPRELEVLQLLAEGLPNKTIAHRLRISEHTAKYHVNAILGKLGAQTRTEAVARAARLGLVLF
jgi:two-component system, NarL family, nitrate/nitrite response regulator NarL